MKPAVPARKRARDNAAGAIWNFGISTIYFKLSREKFFYRTSITFHQMLALFEKCWVQSPQLVMYAALFCVSCPLFSRVNGQTSKVL